MVLKFFKGDKTMPDFSHTKVDPDKLCVCSRNIEDSIQMAERALNEIEESLLITLKPSWSGEGSTAFFDRYNTDKQNFALLINKLKELNAQILQSAGVYDRADTEANALVSSLSVG